jgi:VanZ family protein
MHSRMEINQNLLLIYLIALFGLLFFPITGPKLTLFGIHSDKWVHIALFGGLGMLLRWNFSRKPNPSLMSVAVAVLIIAATEIGQSFVSYRSAEWADALAGLIGTIAGILVMNRILLSASPEKFIGLFVSLLGMMIIVLAVFADVIRDRVRDEFGPFQAAGILLGLLVVVGGVRVYYNGLRKQT